jgi:hypothetical protein
MRGSEKTFFGPLVCADALFWGRARASARDPKNIFWPVLHFLHQNETTAGWQDTKIKFSLKINSPYYTVPVEDKKKGSSFVSHETVLYTSSIKVPVWPEKKLCELVTGSLYKPSSIPVVGNKAVAAFHLKQFCISSSKQPVWPDKKLCELVTGSLYNPSSILYLL